MTAADLALAERPVPTEAQTEALETQTACAIADACSRIAPLWPLKTFVAVNPFLGFTGRSFGAACAYFDRVTGRRLVMPRAYFRERLEAGRIEDRDLEAGQALLEPPAHRLTAEQLRAAARQDRPRLRRPGVVATVSEILDSLAAGDRQLSRTAFMIDEISKWCAAYFDEGQSVWRLPGRDLPLYAAWRAAMRHDRNPEVMGIAGFRALVAQIPADPQAAIGVVLEALGVPARARADYLYRALFDISGWAGYVRYLVWQSELAGGADDRLVQLLAIRVVWGYALFRQRTDSRFRLAWSAAMAEAAAAPAHAAEPAPADLVPDIALQCAAEAAYQRRLFDRLGSAAKSPAAAREGGILQAAFCIDVRSEVFRRALESVCPRAETIGFAGFFGFPIEYVPIGQDAGGAQCPVLLKPSFVVRETVRGADKRTEQAILERRVLRRRAAKAWKAFKLSAISSFSYVESVGLTFGVKMVGDSLGLTRTVEHPEFEGLDRSILHRVGPTIEPQSAGGRQTGFAPDRKLDMAEAVLRGMSLTRGFASLVLLAGHGSTTVNNPHASGLDCGACGGHAGKANARVAAAILNDPSVRDGLRPRGIDIPQSTWFLAALHDTTTDDVAIFDDDLAPADFGPQIDRLRGWLAQAGALARTERSCLLGLAKGENIDRAITRRARDWSQLRPEWGLAGNAAFIAAPRAVTASVSLDGRSFLHSYDWRSDDGFRVLELIMTAPMVVASWINLQYYGSTVDNRAFGAGNKVLHNVCGALGVLEGNAGDLKVGLPLQSVHDGARFVHEPLRLTACIAAPLEAISAVIAKHASVRDLVDNRWLHLFALTDDGRVSHRYHGNCSWETLT